MIIMEEKDSQKFSQEPEPLPVPESGDLVEGGGDVPALQSALADLNRSVERLEVIMAELESGGADSEESMCLLSEANELAVSSSQNLDRLIQDAAYGSGGSASSGEEEGGRQQTFELP